MEALREERILAVGLEPVKRGGKRGL